jgi:hypothetical protein
MSTKEYNDDSEFYHEFDNGEHDDDDDSDDDDEVIEPTVIINNSVAVLNATQNSAREYGYDLTISNEYGKIIRNSTVCPVCIHKNSMEINLSRARDHLSINDISIQFKMPMKVLKTHFENHFILTSRQQRLINFKENSTTETKEIVTQILDENIDLVDGAKSVLEAKVKRLNDIMSFMRDLADRREIDALDDVEKQEYIQYHRIANELEDAILKTYVTIDKKLFPIKREDLIPALISYKLNLLSKMSDQIQIVFLEFERKYPDMISIIIEMRKELASKINSMEHTISKSGSDFKI